MREFFSVAGLVFLAELADKTQLTVLGLSARGMSSWTVFVAGSLGLVVSTALAVLLGDVVQQWVPRNVLNYTVGVLFMALGGWFLLSPYLE